MLFIDYVFDISEEGIELMDDQPDEMLTLDKTPFNIGDHFCLEQREDGRLFFRRVDVRDHYRWPSNV